jgi:hypothetical protein
MRLKAILFLSIFIILLSSGIYLFLNFKMPSLGEKEIKLDDTPLILESVKEMSELFSATTYSEIFLDTLAISKGVIWDTKNRLILIAGGISYASTDLSRLNKDKIKITDSSCTVIIPSARISRTVVNPSDIKIFKEEGDWTLQQVQKIKEIAARKLEEKAEKTDLIQRANNKSTLLFTNLF